MMSKQKTATPRARLCLDQYADTSTITPELAALVKYHPGEKPVAYFPAGTVFEGHHAVALCRTGQAMPDNDECAAQLGMTADQIERLQVEYKMNTLGITEKGDRELFRSGVIAGVNKDGTPIHGPNWSAYQLALGKVDEAEEI